SGLMLNVQDSVIRGFTGNGISFVPTVASVLLVSNTLLSANGLSSGQGVLVEPPSGSAVVEAGLGHLQIDNRSGAGLVASGVNSTGSIPITLSNSVVANNGLQGVLAISTNGNASVTVMVSNSSVVNSGDAGLLVSGPTTLRVTQSVITGNLIGWLNVGGTLQSY